MESEKRFCVEKEDRISELPRNVIDYIFERMPICDAARTSILSTKWRYMWASYPKLVFDVNFFKEINKKYENSSQYEFPKAINKTLFGHCGPILEFILYNPALPIDLSMEIDQWMLFLSRNGIKELEIQNMKPIPYILPSCIFLCRSLIDLKLYNCMLKPPRAFRGFLYLVKLKLHTVSFSSGLSATLLINAPVLKSLAIMRCTGLELQIINAPKLTYFCMVKSGKVVWQRFNSFKELTSLQLVLGMEVTHMEKINMMKFLMDVPKVRTLWLDGVSLQYLDAGTPPQSLTPTCAPFLTCVRLRDFRVGDLDQISSAFFLLKSAPKLSILELDLATSTDNVTEPVKGYLESSDCMNLIMGTLRTVKIRYVKGHKAELLFIKLLLSRAICLKRMFIEQSVTVGASDGFKISRDLLRFYRASSSAEIIYVDPPTSK